jgi:hypothetical protein
VGVVMMAKIRLGSRLCDMMEVIEVDVEVNANQKDDSRFFSFYNYFHYYYYYSDDCDDKEHDDDDDDDYNDCDHNYIKFFSFSSPQ